MVQDQGRGAVRRAVVGQPTAVDGHRGPGGRGDRPTGGAVARASGRRPVARTVRRAPRRPTSSTLTRVAMPRARGRRRRRAEPAARGSRSARATECLERRPDLGVGRRCGRQEPGLGRLGDQGDRQRGPVEQPQDLARRCWWCRGAPGRRARRRRPSRSPGRRTGSRRRGPSGAQCSPVTAAITSLSSSTGQPSASCRVSRNGTSAQPCSWGGRRRLPCSRSIGPGAATPMPSTASSPAAPDQSSSTSPRQLAAPSPRPWPG